MNATFLRHIALMGAALALVTVGCEPQASPEPVEQPAIDDNDPIEDLDATLSLVSADVPGDAVAVDLIYRPAENMERPRTVEVWLKTSPGLTFESAEPLDATLTSGKSLVAQAKPDHEVRLVLFSTANLDRLPPGGIARLHFTASNGSQNETVELLDRRPMFAPAAADKGVLLPEPLTVSAGGS